ncbi:Methyltransferase type [Trema orientale]|uniref:Methyltransferase type n=1 Tax=Trema orientale TaxID=63057 RepID=A0A2P5G1V2_TREOI|nr:Methyltransferase type [Trema orientale]
MVTFVGNMSWVFLQSRLFNSRNPTLMKQPPFRPILNPTFAVNVRATSTSSTSTLVVETNSTAGPVVVENEESKSIKKKKKNILACPICYDPLAWTVDQALSVESVSGSTLQCSTCKKTYFGNETHLELTAASGAKNYGEPMPVATELFRTPLVSFLYERGWRQTFSLWGGFPGPEKEFELTKEFLKPVIAGNIVDASCGSGLFSRLFAKSKLFSLVVALDYSENMLRQCYEFIEQEENFPKENIVLVRADISRLPFASSSVDAVHAGAALHCWPSPLAAVAEISRVLRPGGVFVATTYILDGPFSFLPFLNNIRQNTRQISGSYVFISERELEDLCRASGLVGFTCVRNGAFVMISATKPT